MPSKTPYYIGLMSGTSLDGIDGVLLSFTGKKINLIKHAEIAYPKALQQAFFALFTPANNEIERSQLAGIIRAELAAQLVDTLCCDIDRSQVRAIADHGQTVRHCPNVAPPYSVQIHQGARLAELSSITTVVDFRSKDIASGGQGAPLVPAFHQAFFSCQKQHRLIVNIGGICNISLLKPNDTQALFGFDTGPGNTLMDIWATQHINKAYDHHGNWACSGEVNTALLAHFMEDDYFMRTPPKSTGREHFNLAWLTDKLATFKSRNKGPLEANDVQASLTALTAHSLTLGIAQACAQADIDPHKDLDGLYICGGGAFNACLMTALKTQTELAVRSTEALGIAPKLVEAAAFAWLGAQSIGQNPISLSRATGAVHPNILGAIYPA